MVGSDRMVKKALLSIAIDDAVRRMLDASERSRWDTLLEEIYLTENMFLSYGACLRSNYDTEPVISKFPYSFEAEHSKKTLKSL